MVAGRSTGKALDTRLEVVVEAVVMAQQLLLLL
jgi:hypothetical protein